MNSYLHQHVKLNISREKNLETREVYLPIHKRETFILDAKFTIKRPNNLGNLIFLFISLYEKGYSEFLSKNGIMKHAKCLGIYSNDKMFRVVHVKYLLRKILPETI